jgi:hypothetical protein
MISPELVISSVIALLGVVSTLAGIIYATLSSRIKDQSKIIIKLQEDVQRLSKGCGLKPCLWKNRD